jgi:hypothetical protein
MVPLSLYHEFENYTHFTSTESAVQKADEMLAQLASWGGALRAIRARHAAAA